MRLQVQPAILLLCAQKTWPFWLCIAGIIISWGFGALFGALDEAIFRITGMLLQLFGLASAAWGLRDLKRIFDRPSLIHELASWLRLLQSAFRKPTIVYGSANIPGSIGLSASVNLRVVAAPGSSIERRVEILEMNYIQLQNDMNQAISNNRRQTAEFHRETVQSINKLQKQTTVVSGRLETTALGGFHLQIIGLIWLGLGVVATSVPIEIAARQKAIVPYYEDVAMNAMRAITQWLHWLVA